MASKEDTTPKEREAEKQLEKDLADIDQPKEDDSGSIKAPEKPPGKPATGDSDKYARQRTVDPL